MMVRPSDCTACSQTDAMSWPLGSSQSRGPKRIELPSSHVCGSVQWRKAAEETMRDVSKPAQKRSGGVVAIARSTRAVTAACLVGSKDACESQPRLSDRSDGPRAQSV